MAGQGVAQFDDDVTRLKSTGFTHSWGTSVIKVKVVHKSIHAITREYFETPLVGLARKILTQETLSFERNNLLVQTLPLQRMHSQASGTQIVQKRADFCYAIIGWVIPISNDVNIVRKMEIFHQFLEAISGHYTV